MANSKDADAFEGTKLTRREMMRLAGGLLAAGGLTLLLPEGRIFPLSTAEGAVGMVDTSRYKKPGPWTVGRAGAGDVNAWMIMFSAHYEYGIKERHKGKFKDYFVTAANFDPGKQINDVEDLLSKRIDLLFIDPISEAALVASVEKAMDRGIPVILGSTRVKTEKYVSWITTNNVKAGFLYGDWMGKRLKGEGSVLILLGAPGSSYAEENLKGIRQAFLNYPGIKEAQVVYASWSPVEAKKATEAAIQAGKKIDGIISGGLMGLGAVDAFVSQRKPIPPVGADDWNGWLKKAKQHKVEFYAVAGGSAMSSRAVDVAVKVLSGEPVPRYVEYPQKTFDSSQLTKYLREDLNDNYWAIHELPESWVTKLYKK
ncbi:MAG: substrate-binding domain-containing protein [Armatimonadota bacterium]|nr:substrate-binding domain-containing protein [Armatimonadota bacterium]MDR7467724.1 substrate-binding domain-containing protein [Armatimonadota bacterium]MDR7499811.1 substrate-binding domain-containing protein [Armatimonadota bacterium]MDR7505243.1 substrate-binding domain-containing protein [Armatimonadota bacterium]MDR7573937.1 substrate-binding domain-containing protein [Armatimonadota bacterium]